MLHLCVLCLLNSSCNFLWCKLCSLLQAIGLSQYIYIYVYICIYMYIDIHILIWYPFHSLVVWSFSCSSMLWNDEMIILSWYNLGLDDRRTTGFHFNRGPKSLRIGWWEHVPQNPWEAPRISQTTQQFSETTAACSVFVDPGVAQLEENFSVLAERAWCPFFNREIWTKVNLSCRWAAPPASP